MKNDGLSLVEIKADYEWDEISGTYSVIVTISNLPHMSAVEQMSEWARVSLFDATPKIKGFKRLVNDDQQRIQ